MIANALKFLGADVSYYSRSRKPQYEEKGIGYRPLGELLESSEVVFTCLNKNVILLHEEEFQKLGNGKILFNTSIGPAFEPEDLKKLAGCRGQPVCLRYGRSSRRRGAFKTSHGVLCQCFGRENQAGLWNFKRKSA